MTPQNNNSTTNDNYKSALRAYLSSNLLLPVWILFLFFGGAIFLIYYAQNNFLPDLDANAIVTLLAVASVTGGIFLLSISAGLIIPGLFWSLCVVRVERFAKLWRGRGVRAKKRIAITFLTMSIPFGLLASADSLWGLKLSWFILGLFGSCIIASILIRLLIRQRRWGKRRTKLRWWDYLILGVLGTIAWLFCALPFGFVLKLASNQGQRLNDWNWIVTVLFTLVFVVIINTLIPILSKGNRSAVWITGITLATSLIVLISLNASTTLSAAVMRQYSLGGISNVTMVLNQQGCETLEMLGLKTACAQNDGACRVDQIQIISRLGSSYYLSLNQNGRTIEFTLPNSAIISWTKRPLPPCTSSATPNSR